MIEALQSLGNGLGNLVRWVEVSQFTYFQQVGGLSRSPRADLWVRTVDHVCAGR